LYVGAFGEGVKAVMECCDRPLKVLNRSGRLKNLVSKVREILDVRFPKGCYGFHFHYVLGFHDETLLDAQQLCSVGPELSGLRDAQGLRMRNANSRFVVVSAQVRLKSPVNSSSNPWTEKRIDA
jgi:hypothetical protein